MAGRRSLLVTTLAICMAVHAVVIGRYLESVFFLTAFPWAWVGLAALRGDLVSARTMVLTMIGVLSVSSALLLLVGTQQHGLTAFFSLARLPGAVTWISVLFYIAYLAAGPEEDEAELDAKFAVAMNRWMTAPPDRSNAAVAGPAQATVSPPLAAGTLTPEAAVQIVGPIRAQRPARDAA